MRIHLPNSKEPIYGELRDLEKFRDDLWQLKITVPSLSIIDNLYISLSEEEIDFIEQEIRRYRPSRSETN